MVGDHTGGAMRVAVSSVLAAVVLALTGAMVWAVGPGPNPNGPVNRQHAAQAPTWQNLIQSLERRNSAELLAENGNSNPNGTSETPSPSVDPTPSAGQSTPSAESGMEVQFDHDGGEITVVPTKGGTSLVSVNTAPSGGVFVRPVNGPITSAFGIRFHPVLRVWKLHTGTDFGARCAAPIGAAYKGTVVFTGWGGGNGWRVVVDHGVINGHRVQTSYNHLSLIGVRVGQKVVAHQMLGKVGNTGYSTGCHLHFEVLVDGRFSDPMPWLTGKPSVVKPGPLPDLTPKLPPGEKLNTKPEGDSDVGTDAPEPSGTPSATPTPSTTPSGTPTPTPSVDPSATPSVDPSGTPSTDPSGTPGPSGSPTPGPGSTDPSGTPSPTPSGTPSSTPSTTPTPTPTPKPSPTPTPSNSVKPTPTPSSSPTPTRAPSSASQTPSGSPTPPSGTPSPSGPAGPVASPKSESTPDS